jgi:hypothetical protein
MMRLGQNVRLLKLFFELSALQAEINAFVRCRQLLKSSHLTPHSNRPRKMGE